LPTKAATPVVAASRQSAANRKRNLNGGFLLKAATRCLEALIIAQHFSAGWRAGSGKVPSGTKEHLLSLLTGLLSFFGRLTHTKVWAIFKDIGNHPPGKTNQPVK
jgi:hypothetical protein